jgi:multidrug efflux pump subunit AcrA (membrane-fusion protein)
MIMSAGAPEISLDALLAPTDGARRTWWRRRSMLVVTAVVIVIVVIVAFATGAIGSSGDSYRTATVTRRAVDSELTSVATIEPVSQASVGFPSSGTVKSVAVQVGDEVAAGADLAQLDTQSLENDLHSAEADLAQAQLTLENGLNGQKATSAPTNGTGGTGNTGTLSSASTSQSSSGARIVLAATTTDPELAAAQQAVLHAQQNVDAALATASTEYENAVAVCSADPPDSTACEDALAASLAAQKDVQTAQNQLVQASIAYDDLLSQRAAQGGDNPDPTNGSTPSGATTPNSSSSPTTGGSVPSTGGGASTQAPSAADLVSYQKSVDAAASQVAVAQQALDQATITTPVAGKVVAVNLTAGESVSDAATQNIIVQGAGGLEATTTVGVDDVSTVKVGQRAYVTPDGTSKRLEGSVATISAAPISSGSTDYRVTIALKDANASINNGSTGMVTIVTEQSDSGLAVPTSAISTLGSRHFVTVDDGGSTSQVTVEVGVLGREWTSITSGVTAGQEVVLADLGKALPTSATASSNGGSSGGFTFPGGGGGPPNFRAGN